MRSAMKTVLAWTLTLALVQASPALAGLEQMPTRLDLERFTCRDLMELPSERQERALVYLTGVVDGRRRATVFDAVSAGATIDRLLATCRATPTLIVLDALIAASVGAVPGSAGGR